MTFGVIGKEQPLLAELLMLAFQSAGHECLLFEDTDQATRILHAIRVDSIVLDIHLGDRDNLAWLETMVATWPDLPSRTLLLAHDAVTPETAARIQKLGADVIPRPLSIVGVQRVVMERLQKAHVERAGRGYRDPEPEPLPGFVN
jgi:DNA-binding response OmpR family regulator